MAITSSWIHGNALTIESPVHYNPEDQENGWLRLTPYGWGAEVFNEGHPVVSWMHVPISTIKEELSRFERFNLLRVILLFKCLNAIIDSVHVYDGRKLIQEFNNLSLKGSFLIRSVKNTFQLTQPYTVKTGIGLSFWFIPPTSTGTGQKSLPEPTLLVAAAGAEFETTSILLRPP